jgi:predicted RND superfamily exporter protein
MTYSMIKVSDKNVYERLMGKVGKLVATHSAKICLAFSILTLVMLLPMSQLEMETKMDDFNPDNEFRDAAIIIGEEFNSTDTIVNIVEEKSETMLDREGLLLLMQMENDIRASEKISPYLITHEDAVLSIADPVELSLRYASNGTYGIADAPDIQLDFVMDSVIMDPNASALVSQEGDKALFLVMVDGAMHSDDSEKGDESMELEIEIILDNDLDEKYEVYSLGGWDTDMQNKTEEDLIILLPITLLVLIGILAFTLRSPADVVISLIGLASSLVISFGVLVVARLPFNQMTFFAPIMIMVLSIDYVIHILLRYKEENNSGENAKAMEHTIKFTGISILLSALTTIVAFASNAISSIPAVAAFGTFLAIGIGISLAVMLLFVPSLKLVMTRPSKKPVKVTEEVESNRNRLNKVTHVTYNHPVAVMLIALLVTFGAYGLSTMVKQNLALEDVFSSKSEKLMAVNILEEEFYGIGVQRISILVSGDIADPDVLIAMDETIVNMGDDVHVATSGDAPVAYSVILMIKGMVASGNFPVSDADANGVPDTRDECLFLLNYLYNNGTPDVDVNVVHEVLSRGNNGFDRTRIIVEVRDVEGTKSDDLLSEIESDTLPIESAGANVQLAGGSFETTSMMDAMTDGMMVSTLISILLCAFIVIILFQSARFGIVAVIPVSMVTIWILGSIYLLGFNLNPVTATTTAMTVGIGVDYSIHLIERYRQERRSGKEILGALDLSINTTGIALLAAGVTTASGFGIISFSNVGMFHAFGTLAFLIIVYVLMVSILVLPAIIVLTERLTEKWKKD